MANIVIASTTNFSMKHPHRKYAVKCLCTWIGAALMVWGLLPLRQGMAVEREDNSVASEGSSSAEAKKSVIAVIPFHQLSAQEATAVKSVIHGASVYRKMPTKVIQCDTDLFSHLVKNPEIVANTWEVLGMSKLKLQAVDGKNFIADDGNGSRGKMRIISAESAPGATHRILIYAEGTYEGKPLIKPVNARCVCLLQSASTLESNGKHYITARLDTFVQFDQLGLDLIARTLHPLIASSADHNFSESMDFVASFSKAAEENPSGVERLCKNINRVSIEDRATLIQIAHQMKVKNDALQQMRQANHLSNGSAAPVRTASGVQATDRSRGTSAPR